MSISASENGLEGPIFILLRSPARASKFAGDTQKVAPSIQKLRPRSRLSPQREGFSAPIPTSDESLQTKYCLDGHHAKRCELIRETWHDPLQAFGIPGAARIAVAATGGPAVGSWHAAPD